MSLSIIPLSQPLYNVYQAYDEVYNKFGNNVFVSALFDSKTMGAPSTTVKALADVYCDALVTLYNLRISTKIRGESETGIAIYYLMMAIILLVVIASALGYAIYKTYVDLLENDVKEANKFFYKMVLYFISIITAFLFIITIAIISFVRMSQVNNKINNIKFSQDAAVFSNRITTLFPYLLTNIKGKKYLKYVTSPAERGMYDSLVTFSKLFKAVKNKEGFTYNLLPTQNKALQAIIVYQLQQRGVQFNAMFDNGELDGIRFPGFDDGFKPSLLLREIQKVDLVGQVNRIGDAMTYFKTLLRKSQPSSEQSSSNVKSVVIDNLKQMFNSKILVSKEFVPAVDISNIVYKNAGDSTSCSVACDNSQQCAISIFNKNGTCALINKDVTKNYPLFYASDGATSDQYETMIKGGSDMYVSSSSSSRNLKALPMKMRFLDNKPRAVLETENACLYDAQTTHCLSDNYASLKDTPADFVGAFAENTQSQAIQAQNDGNHFTVRTTTDNAIDTLITKNNSVLENTREHYLIQATNLVKRLDPSLSVKLTDSEIEEIGNASSPDMHDIVVSVLQDLPQRLQDMKTEENNEQIIDRRDAEYVDGQGLLNKLGNMSDNEFVSEFVTHLYNVSSCSEGLYKIYSFYDFTVQDIQKGKLLLNLFATLIMIQGLVFLVHSFMQTYPKYTSDLEELDIAIKKKQSKDKKDTVNTLAASMSVKELRMKGYNMRCDYYIKYSLIIGVIVLTIVLLQVSAQRRERIGLYNYDIMRKNGDTLKQHSAFLFDQLLDDIYKGHLMTLPPDNAVFRSISQNIERTYMIDAFKENLKLFSSKTKVTIKNIDGKYLRDKIVDMIEAHEKCNSLLFGSNVNMPFPVYEVSIYVFLVIVVIICLAVIYFKLNPIHNFKMIKYWRRIQENGKRMKHIIPSELKFTSEDSNNLGMDTDLLIKIFMVLIIPFAVLLFASQVLKSTSNLSTALYGSNLYRTSECYDL